MAISSLGMSLAVLGVPETRLWVAGALVAASGLAVTYASIGGREAMARHARRLLVGTLDSPLPLEEAEEQLAQDRVWRLARPAERAFVYGSTATALVAMAGAALALNWLFWFEPRAGGLVTLVLSTIVLVRAFLALKVFIIR